MARYWLTPVTWEEERVTLGSERFSLEPEALHLPLVRKLRERYPRLLLPFKIGLLLGDEADEEACGTSAIPFAMDGGKALTLAAAYEDSAQEGVWPLSHCAEAYLHRLPLPHEALEWLSAGEEAAEGELPAWLERMKDWLKAGAQVIMLKEESHS
ncbi:hypothetical protein O9H85_01850 [Paenibacillus filicis]|uniref:Uncharacterized protein n=1 Tax=Paenibacillus gyeongsangnamensis TaxID=3388067 RepID=A0ABT4Q2Y1_9BACL|nr:hypothetical protein [Paenibacillus filicis]MCZ8511201.1 hypothetical protein [Paenibacillus filicis]